MRDFLVKLFETTYHAVYANTYTEPLMTQKVIDYFTLAIKDAIFKEKVLFPILENSTVSCSDSVGYICILIGNAKKLYEISKDDPSDVATFIGRTIWTIEEIHKAANQKISALREVKANEEIDPIEVQLYYILGLSHVFGFEVDMDRMLFPACADSTQENLDIARDMIYPIISNEENYCIRLIQTEKWITVLKEQFNEEMEQAEEQRDEDAIDPEKAVNALGIYNQTLIKLTKQLLADNPPWNFQLHTQ